jgi:hypothetical protein
MLKNARESERSRESARLLRLLRLVQVELGNARGSLPGIGSVIECNTMIIIDYKTGNRRLPSPLPPDGQICPGFDSRSCPGFDSRSNSGHTPLPRGVPHFLPRVEALHRPRTNFPEKGGGEKRRTCEGSRFQPLTDEKLNLLPALSGSIKQTGVANG